MFTLIAAPAAPVTIDSFLRIGFRITFRPPHLRFSTTPSSARRPDMSHNESCSDANVQRPKKLICTSDTSTRPRCDAHTPATQSSAGNFPRSYTATKLQANSNSTSQSPPETLKLGPSPRVPLLLRRKHTLRSHLVPSRPKPSAPKPRHPVPRPKARFFPTRREHTSS
jgi:hypothetical protein